MIFHIPAFSEGFPKVIFQTFLEGLLEAYSRDIPWCMSLSIPRFARRFSWHSLLSVLLFLGFFRLHSQINRVYNKIHILCIVNEYIWIKTSLPLVKYYSPRTYNIWYSTKRHGIVPYCFRKKLITFFQKVLILWIWTLAQTTWRKKHVVEITWRKKHVVGTWRHSDGINTMFPTRKWKLV